MGPASEKDHSITAGIQPGGLAAASRDRGVIHAHGSDHPEAKRDSHPLTMTGLHVVAARDAAEDRAAAEHGNLSVTFRCKNDRGTGPGAWEYSK